MRWRPAQGGDWGWGRAGAACQFEQTTILRRPWEAAAAHNVQSTGTGPRTQPPPPKHEHHEVRAQAAGHARQAREWEYSNRQGMPPEG